MSFILLGIKYDKEENHIKLIFYDEETKQLKIYNDPFNFKHYFLTNLDQDQFYNIQRIKLEQDGNDTSELVFQSLATEKITKFNPINNMNEEFLKVYGNTPLDIYDPYHSGKGLDVSSRLIFEQENEKKINYAFEREITYESNYIFDNDLHFGMPYVFKSKKISIKQSKKCQFCGKNIGTFRYYSSKTMLEKNGIVLGKIICKSCKEVVWTNTTIDLTQYKLLFTVIRPFDIETVSVNKFVPVLESFKIKSEFLQKIESSFKNEISEEKELMRQWLPLFFTTIPTKLNRLSYDIEVYVPNKDIFPLPDEANYPVSDLSAIDIEGNRHIFLLKVWKEEGLPYELPQGIIFHEYAIKEEKKMLLDIFKFLQKYPIIVDFNGTNFDIPYMFFRALKIGIPKEDIPFYARKSNQPSKYYVSLKWDCLHFDLYKLFSNRSLKVYAFNNAYEEDSLRSVTKSLLPMLNPCQDIPIREDKDLIGLQTNEKLGISCLKNTQENKYQYLGLFNPQDNTDKPSFLIVDRDFWNKEKAFRKENSE